MLFPKPTFKKTRAAQKRRDKKEMWTNPVVESARLGRCVCCDRSGPSDPHHLKGRGANRGALWINDVWNVVGLCRRCHTTGVKNIHGHGITVMADQFPRFKDWLIKQNWAFCPNSLQWSHAHA